jgi:hypothetical protein
MFFSDLEGGILVKKLFFFYCDMKVLDFKVFTLKDSDLLSAN